MEKKFEVSVVYLGSLFHPPFTFYINPPVSVNRHLLMYYPGVQEAQAKYQESQKELDELLRGMDGI